MMFSIIIPCYNTELWLEDCLKSIIKQKYKDWEMLLVNDGSIDNTSSILNDYAKKDSRINVIHQENQGVSAARNTAIKKARGDYLMFLDSDDCYKDEYCLEQIAKSLDNRNVDIVVFRYQIIQNKDDICNKEYLQYLKKMEGYIYTGEEYLQVVLSEDEGYPWFPVLYAFKREIWIKNKFQFNTKLWIHEDKDILYQVILKAQRIEVLGSVIYQYRYRSGSATRSKSKESLKSQLSVCINNINKVNHMNINQNLKKLLNSNFSYTYFLILMEVNYLKREDQKEILALLKENCKLMDCTIRKKSIFISRMAHVLGLHFTAKLLFVYHKLKM